MKKLMLILVVLSVVLFGCSSPVSEPDVVVPNEPFSFDGHWNVYNTDLTYHGVDIFFEGDRYWGLVNDRMTGGGPYSYTETEFTMWVGSYNTYHGTQRYEIIDKDTVLFYPPHDGMSYFSWNNRIKRSGRTGRIVPLNGAYTFVDD
jgi:hypothetical protein